RELKHINALIIRRIDPDLAEIKRARIDRAHSCPVFAVVFRPENTAALTSQIAQGSRTAFKALHNCRYNFRVACADGQTDAPGLCGQTAAQFFPGRAAVATFENSANVLAAGCVRTGSETPGSALPRVKRCVDRLRIAWIENHVATAGARVVRRRRLQNQFPRFPAVSGFIESTLATVGP